MVVYQANPIPPLLRDVAAGRQQDGLASQVYQQAELRKQQAELNRVLAEQRLAVQAAREAAREASQQGRYH